MLALLKYSYSILTSIEFEIAAFEIKGLCNTETKAGIFRKKSNTSRSRLSINQGSSNRQTSSCPSSPRQGMRLNSSTSSLTQYEQNAATTPTTALHRSASTMSSLRPRSSPSGLFSYTGKSNRIKSNIECVQSIAIDGTQI